MVVAKSAVGEGQSFALTLLLVIWVSGAPLPTGVTTWAPCSDGARSSILKLEVGVQEGLCKQKGRWLSSSVMQGCSLFGMASNYILQLGGYRECSMIS